MNLTTFVRLLAVFGLVCGAASSRAAINFSMEIWNGYNGSFYYPAVYLNNPTPAPVTYHRVESENGLLWRNVGTNNDGNNFFLTNDLAVVVRECTNGLWKLWLNKGHASEELYHFKVNITGVTPGTLGGVQVFNPLSGSANVPVNSTFHFAGPVNLPLLSVQAYDANAYFQFANLPSTATNWTPASPMPGGAQVDFYINYRSNNHFGFTFSTPTNSSGTPLSGWSPQGNLGAYVFSTFTTAAGGGGGGGHALTAHYTFNDNNIFATDSSGNGNGIGSISSYGGGSAAITTNALEGNFAAIFSNNGGAGASWLKTPNPVLASVAGSFSVSAWVKTADTFGDDEDEAYQGQGIIGAFNGGSGETVIPMALTGNKLAFFTGGSPQSTLHSQADINTGDYVHLVVTRDQATGQKKIYVDGVLDQTGGGSTALLDGPDELHIGWNNNNGFNGKLDDIQFYTGVLSAAEVQFLYNNPGQTVPDVVADPLADAVDAPQFVWTTGGDANWFPQTSVTHDGVDAARSGALGIGSFGSTWIETEVTGPGTVTFWWRNIDDDDSFNTEFYIDGGYENNIYGTTGWEQAGPYAIGPGTHTLRWEAYDDGTTDPDAAAYLDEVVFTPTPVNPLPVITRNPFSQTNRPGYQAALHADGTNVNTWQWYKVGTGLISGATTNLYIPTNSGTAGVAGSYFAVASNGSGSVTSLIATVTFASAALPPDWSQAFRTPLNSVNFSERRTNYGICFLLESGTNIYAANSFTGTNTYNSGADTVISGPGKFGTVLMKQTTTGTLLWARGLTNTGNGNSYPQSMAPAPGGGVYVSGVFAGTNGLGTNVLTETAGASPYLARFDANGNVLWVRTVTGTNGNYQSYHQLVADPAGNVTLSALINHTVTIGATNFTAPGQKGLLVQFDANGNLRWGQVLSGWAAYLTYSAGRIYGSMGGNETNFIGGLTNTSDRQWTLFALNATNGQAIWLRNIAARLGESAPADQPNVSVSGTNIFIVGTAAGSNAVFGPFNLSWPENLRQYFARYDTNGTAQIATTFGSATLFPWAAMADASGNVYVGGDFDTYATFGSNIVAGYRRSGIGGSNPSHTFVAKFDRDGNSLWARTAQSPGYYVNCRDIALASDGVWTIGFVMQSALFGTNQVFGTSFIISSELQYLAGGALGKITDSVAAPSPNPVTLLSPANSGGNFQFSFLSQSPFSHVVQYRTNLVLGTWQTWSTIPGDGGVKNVSIPTSTFGGAGRAFVRVATQ